VRARYRGCHGFPTLYAVTELTKPPFRMLSQAEYIRLTPEEKLAYLKAAIQEAKSSAPAPPATKPAKPAPQAK
jgi:hypothetical protein